MIIRYVIQLQWKVYKYIYKRCRITILLKLLKEDLTVKETYFEKHIDTFFVLKLQFITF